MLSKQKGDMAVGIAISYFMSNGYEVALPIGDKRSYNLIIEKDNKLARVQVKYAGAWGHYGQCVASLRVMGGNQSFYTARKYTKESFDYLFVYSAKNEAYFFPWRKVTPTSAINVEAPKYMSYKVDMQG